MTMFLTETCLKVNHIGMIIACSGAYRTSCFCFADFYESFHLEFFPRLAKEREDKFLSLEGTQPQLVLSSWTGDSEPQNYVDVQMFASTKSVTTLFCILRDEHITEYNRSSHDSLGSMDSRFN